TTARLSAGDAIACGFADHYVPSDKIEEFIEALSATSVEDALGRFAEPAPVSDLLAQQSWIDAAYSADSVVQILSRLQSSGVPEAVKAAEQLLSKSPTAVAVTLRSLRRARAAGSLEEVLNEEFRVSVACLKSHDLVEGIRAQVVEKDRNPQWLPATSEEVTEDEVATFFAPLGDLELGLTPPQQHS
ncbi:MAG: enoyl-CoA hydratase/isomerase family protein, partial [Rhodococcus sp. (in: high G+C Gram-positive bacteria)]|uniref:enoyl-CoA hydratase/isomerase family protein n=1 Tax=Rhodococcus sp. TaxID=1831 RepID=UPI003BB15792